MSTDENWDLISFRIPEELASVSVKVAEDETTPIGSKSEAIRYALDRKFEGSQNWEPTTEQDENVDELFREYGEELVPEMVEHVDRNYRHITESSLELSIELAEKVLLEDYDASDIAEEYLRSLEDEDLY